MTSEEDVPDDQKAGRAEYDAEDGVETFGGVDDENYIPLEEIPDGHVAAEGVISAGSGGKDFKVVRTVGEALDDDTVAELGVAPQNRVSIDPEAGRFKVGGDTHEERVERLLEELLAETKGVHEHVARTDRHTGHTSEMTTYAFFVLWIAFCWGAGTILGKLFSGELSIDEDRVDALFDAVNRIRAQPVTIV